MDSSDSYVTLPRFDLTVAAGSRQDFELWRWAVSPMFSMDASSTDERDSFGMNVKGFHFADVALSRTQSSPTRFDRDRAVIARSGIDNVMLQFYEDSDYRLSVDGRQTIVAAGDIAVFDLTRPSVIDTGAYTNLSIVLPRRALATLVPDLDRVHGLILRAGSPLNVLLKSHLQNLLAEAPRLDMAAAGALAAATLGLVAACMSQSASSREHTPPVLAGATLRLIRQTIDANLANSDLGPELLSKQFGMSRATLYRLFEPLGGVRNYVQQRRLMQACRSITDPAHFNERISTIAGRWGFSDHTVFSRAFRSTYGVSPSDARALAQKGLQGAAPSRETEAGSFWAVNRWLFGLETQTG